MLDLSDSHTHLEDYGPQLPEVVQRARDVGVRRIITAGSSLESSKAACTDCRRVLPTSMQVSGSIPTPPT